MRLQVPLVVVVFSLLLGLFALVATAPTGALPGERGDVASDELPGAASSEEATSGEPPAGARRAPSTAGTAQANPWGLPQSWELPRPATVSDPSSLLVLVNKTYGLPPDYAPSDLVQPDIPFTVPGDSAQKLLRREAAEALEQLFRQAARAGIRLYGVSGYRSYERQQEIYTRKVSQRGEEATRFNAPPGHSEHQTGLAIDVSSPSVDYRLVQAFGDTPEGRWLARHAAEAGFIIRYPAGKECITGYAYEPWHLRYVGVPAARYLMEHGLTLEEYLLPRGHTRPTI